MQKLLPSLALGLSLAVASVASAQTALLSKQTSYTQTDSSGAILATATGFPAYTFIAKTAATATLTPPGLAAVTVPFSSNQFSLSQLFATKSALDAAFPTGSYRANISGYPTVAIGLTGDLYPSSIPSLVGGNWRNGAVVVNPAQGATLNFSTFTGYGSTTGGQVAGHVKIQVSTFLGSDNLQLRNEVVSVPVGSTTVSPTPVNSITIPAGALVAGNLYQVVVDFDTVTTLDTTSIPGGAVVGLYENELYFYVAAQSSNPPPTPTISLQPSSLTAPAGTNATFPFVSTPAWAPGSQTQAATFIWYFNGLPLPAGGGNGKYTFSPTLNLTVNNLTAADAGVYVMVIFNGAGVAYTQPATLTVSAPVAPSISAQPANLTVPPGSPFSFRVTATGTAPLTYQWSFNGVPIPAATTATFSFASAAAVNAGAYSVTVTNSLGAVTSTSATLTVAAAGSPVIVTQPVPRTVATGSTVVFTVGATGNPIPTYQWTFNGAPIVGATLNRYVLTGATAANAGNYGCQATNLVSTVPSAPALLTVINTANPGRLINLSVNATAGKNHLLTVGFVTGGAGTSGSESLLIRATGPALAAFGASGTLTDPTLTVLSGQTPVASNDNWGTPASNQSAVATAATATGAFPLTTASSLDAALVVSLPSGLGYTVQVSGNDETSGTTLAEIYDNTPAASYTPASPRLIDVSALDRVSAGGFLSAGFVIGGSTSKTVLIRATGPALAGFGVQGTMPDPQIALHTNIGGQDSVIASNAGWGGDPQLTTLGTAVGAFPIVNGASRDSVVVVTLAPGPYAAAASSVSGAPGSVLLEVYEVP